MCDRVIMKQIIHQTCPSSESEECSSLNQGDQSMINSRDKQDRVYWWKTTGKAGCGNNSLFRLVF